MSTDTRDQIAREVAHTVGMRPDDPPLEEHYDCADTILRIVAARLLREDGEREVWRHFKGNLYEVLMRGCYEHSGETCVIYRRADGSDPSVWVRPQTFGTGAWEDWVEVDGAEVPRFERVASDSQSGPQGGPLSAGKRGPHPGVAEVEQVQRFSEMRADNLLTEDDPFTLMGFALLEAERGKREMPAYLFELAARICLARGDTATAARVREMEVQHLAEPPALAHPDAGSEARELVEWVLLMDGALEDRDDHDAIWQDTVRCARALKARMDGDSFGDSFGDPLATAECAPKPIRSEARERVARIAWDKSEEIYEEHDRTAWEDIGDHNRAEMMELADRILAALRGEEVGNG